MIQRRGRLCVTFAFVAALASSAFSQSSQTRLGRDQFRSGEEILHTFAPVSTRTRHSIVKFNVDGETACLGAIISSNGLALTKASELKKGKLTCWTADDKHVDAELISTDEDDDVALVRVKAEALIPIEWADDEVHVGQWAITPGIASTPHAVGIISVLPRKIRPQRAYIGVRFDLKATAPKVGTLTAGLGAEKAGLKPGDVILAVNGNAVSDRKEVVDALSEFREGQTITLRLQRAEDQFNAEIRMMAPVADMFEDSPDSFPRVDRLQGQVSQRAEGFEQAIEHDTVLKPWLCGGPLVNLEGKAIGLNIARAGRVTTYALPTKLVKRIIKNLQEKASGNG
jgi:serine protease Do